MELKESVDSVFNRQANIAQWINDHLARHFPVDRKSHLALACFDLAVEHHAAICALCASVLYGSMYALLRVESEAYVRGLWLRHVASEVQVGDFEKDKLNIKFGDLLTQIEDQIGPPSRPLSTFKSTHWDIFNSFTHTGYQALVRRVNKTYTGPVNYRNEDVISALRLAGTIAWLSAAELSSIAADQALIEETMAKAKGYASELGDNPPAGEL